MKRGMELFLVLNRTIAYSKRKTVGLCDKNSITEFTVLIKEEAKSTR